MVTTTSDINNSNVTSFTNQAKSSASVKTAKGGLEGLADNFDTFLTLLTTQLKNQDPTSPMETNEFTNQLVAFTGVEQQIKSNDFLEELIGLSKGTQSSTAVAYIGKYAQVEDSQVTLANKKADFSYEISGEASKASVVITSDSGNVIYSEVINAPKGGLQKLTWDGRTNAGGTAKDGTYNVSITATDTNGKQINSKIYTAGRISGADFSSGEVMLTVGGSQIPVSKIVKISENQAI